MGRGTNNGGVTLIVDLTQKEAQNLDKLANVCTNDTERISVIVDDNVDYKILDTALSRIWRRLNDG